MAVRVYHLLVPAFLAGALSFALPGIAGGGSPAPVVYGFEGFSDGDALTTQYKGLTFSNAVVATAGVSLDEFEAPPHSGVNVVEDSIGPISIQFSSPVAGFGGYFNYSVPLTLTAFNAGGQEIGAETSLFSDNFALSGDPGSHSNEFLQVLDPSGLSSVTITGAPGGGSFTLDDATVTPAAVPEVSTVVSTGLLLLLGLGSVVVSRKRLRSRRS